MAWLTRIENDRFAFRVDSVNPEAVIGFCFGLISDRGLKIAIEPSCVHVGDKVTPFDFHPLRDILPGDTLSLEISSGNFLLFLNWRKILTVKLGSFEKWVSAFVERKDQLVEFCHVHFSKPGNCNSRVTFQSSNGNFDVDIPCIIGRKNFQSPSISREHAKLEFSENGVTVEDLKSVNGTFVNNRRLFPHQPFRILNGDRIRLGEVTFIITSYRIYEFKFPDGEI